MLDDSLFPDLMPGSLLREEPLRRRSFAEFASVFNVPKEFTEKSAIFAKLN
jgi:hypothetical protein